jgi:hypothetical protein
MDCIRHFYYFCVHLLPQAALAVSITTRTASTKDIVTINLAAHAHSTGDER